MGAGVRPQRTPLVFASVFSRYVQARVSKGWGDLDPVEDDLLVWANHPIPQNQSARS